MVFEKIGPLARLRRRGLRKHERDWRIVELGRICPVCAVPVKVSSQEVGNNLAATEFKCPKCWRVWGYVEQIQCIRRKPADLRPPNVGCGARAEPGEPDKMFG
jgi:hypothetical protein